MASGLQHDIACVRVAHIGFLSAGFLALYLGHSIPYALCLGVGAWVGGFLGIPLSPDLDLVNKRLGGCSAISIWRTFFLHWYWGFYGKLPHHSKWSHWPILGTVGRILYLAPLGFSVWKIIDHIGINEWPVVVMMRFGLFIVGTGWINGILIAVLINLALADTVHWLLDGAPVGPGNSPRCYLLRFR